MSPYVADPLFCIRPRVERYGLRATKHGRRGFALMYGHRPIIRRRQFSTFLQACAAAVAFLDALAQPPA
jgi:hypothetical protein